MKARYYLQMKDYTAAYGAAHNGISAQFQPHNLIPYQENLLILAKAGTRKTLAYSW